MNMELRVGYREKDLHLVSFGSSSNFPQQFRLKTGATISTWVPGVQVFEPPPATYISRNISRKLDKLEA